MDIISIKMKVKLFFSKHKAAIMAVTGAIIGGVIVYTITKNISDQKDHEADDDQILNVLKDSMSKDTAVLVTKSIADDVKHDYDVPSLEAAIDKFKEYQETNDTVAMFWENETYSVLDLEPKADDVEKEIVNVLETITDEK